MHKRIFILSIVLVITGMLSAQKKELTIEDAVIGRWRQFNPEHLSGVLAYAEDDFSHVKNYNTVFLMNKTGKEVKTLFTLDDINTALKSQSLEELPYFPYWDYDWINNDQVLFGLDNKKYIYNISKKSVDYKYILPENADNIRPCKENLAIAYTVLNNLYFMDNNGKSIQVTNDENPGIVNANGYTHRQEFGIDNGIFWSPAGNYIAFYRKDETMVTDYPLVDITTRIATLKNTKYPMIGEKSEEVTLGIYNLKTGKTVFAEVTDFTPERYLTSISWSPDEQFIFIGVLNREQNWLKMNKYNAADGNFVKTIYEEQNPKYVEPEHPLIFDDGLTNQFITFSERDGFNHLYLYDTNGKLIKQLTKGNWLVNDFLGFDKDKKFFFITATKDSPIQKNLYKVNFKTGEIIRITNENGEHDVVLSASKNTIFDFYSSQTVPGKAAILNNKGAKLNDILSAVNPLTDYDLGEMKIGTVKAADNKTDLYYQLITPPDLDPKKKYPVIVYVYGGPHAQMITDSWLGGASLWNYYMAQKGYIVFTIDNRGSSNRGFEFESVIHRQCGVEEMKDQLRGIDFLKSLPYVDADRIGVHGWSYGGFMTTSLMTTYPETFKVGVAGGPVIDWKYYEVMYGERYMDTPSENPEGFENTSLLNKADKLQGRLMIIHGYQDPVVVPQNSIDFIRSCVAAGTDIDFFLYPESEHNMFGDTRVHLMKKVTRYFDDFLK